MPSRGWVGWYDAVWLLFAIVLIASLVRHFRRRVPLVPESGVGKAQLLYLCFLWLITLMSYAHEVPTLSPVVLATQWWLTVNAIVCTWIVTVRTPLAEDGACPSAGFAGSAWNRRILILGVVAALCSPVFCWQVKRWLYDDRAAPGFYMDHIRFGPHNTNDTV